MRKAALVVAGLVFSVVALVHVLRYVKSWKIVFENFTVPMNWSIYGAIFAGVLALWMFASVFDCKK